MGSPKIEEIDEVRHQILEYLYKVHKSARGISSTRKKISDIKKDMKKVGLSQSQVSSNLDYLIQTGWVTIESIKRPYSTPQGHTGINKTEYYKISDVGIDYFEGQSAFQRMTKNYSGINITNIQGVVTLGDSNTVVNQQYSKLYESLNSLSEAVRSNPDFSDEDKLNYTSDIETIKSQLSKTKPDINIIKESWEQLKPLATASGIITFFGQAAQLIGGLL